MHVDDIATHLALSSCKLFHSYLEKKAREYLKSRIWETKNLLACAVSSTTVGWMRIPKITIFLKNGKIIENAKTQKRLEICQYWRYDHRPEVSNPAGSVVSKV